MRVVLLSLRCFLFFQAEDGIRDLVRSRGLGDVYKRQVQEKLVIMQFQKVILKKFLIPFWI